MMKKIILFAPLFWCCLWVSAQLKIEISPTKPQKVEVRLCDYFKATDNYLMNLPLTFSITDKKILIIMVGNDFTLDYERSVWLFAKDTDLAELMKKNHNVNASKTFKNQNRVLYKFLSRGKMTYFRSFEDGYEVVKKNAKPVFFDISSLPPNVPITFSLQFYVTQPDSNFSCVFLARCKPIEIELTLKP
jgi:hypothetical protein